MGARLPLPTRRSSPSWRRPLSVDTASLAAALPRRHATTPLGELILARQRELGLRSVDLAGLTGTTEATISRWVQGRSRPVPKNLVRLADALADAPTENLSQSHGVQHEPLRIVRISGGFGGQVEHCPWQSSRPPSQLSVGFPYPAGRPEDE